LRDLTNWNLFIASHGGEFIRIDSAADIENAKAAGKVGIILGLQNSQHFRTAADVDFFYGIGQRVSQLTYYDNRLGGGSTDPRGGLTEFGAEIVARMNRLGMAVDVSHCADRTTLDAVELSSKPVLVTHSNCRALVANNTRCKTDEAIRRMAVKGGVFGVTMVRPFVRAGGRTTIEDVLNHIDHVAAVAGVESVGLGTDVDLDGRELGSPRTSDLDGMQYAKKIYDVTEGLVRRNYLRQDIELILGGNFQRALTAIWNA
jgi:membrane dipeptidase